MKVEQSSTSREQPVMQHADLWGVSGIPPGYSCAVCLVCTRPHSAQMSGVTLCPFCCLWFSSAPLFWKGRWQSRQRQSGWGSACARAGQGTHVASG